MNVDGSKTINLTDHPANDFSDRDRSAGNPEVEDNIGLYVLRLSDGQFRRRTHWPRWDIYGSFSPDDTQVAFSRSRPDGAGLARLTYTVTID